MYNQFNNTDDTMQRLLMIKISKQQTSQNLMTD